MRLEGVGRGGGGINQNIFTPITTTIDCNACERGDQGNRGNENLSVSNQRFLFNACISDLILAYSSSIHSSR